MAKNKLAKKRILISAKKTERNKYYKTKIKNIIKFDNEESQISLKAKDTFFQASMETLNSGDSILRVIGNSIYTIYPNGEKIKLKDIKTPIKVNKNSKIFLKEIM